jgi:hypothetical protein
LLTRIIQVDGKSSLHQVVLRRSTDIEYYDSDEPNYVSDLPIEVAPGNHYWEFLWCAGHHPRNSNTGLLSACSTPYTTDGLKHYSCKSLSEPILALPCFLCLSPHLSDI